MTVLVALLFASLASAGEPAPVTPAAVTPAPVTPAVTAPADPHAAEIKDAGIAAQAFLALLDAGKYDESRSLAAAIFSNAIVKERWGPTLDAARRPLGAVTSRALKSATYATALPGAPDGKYVVIEFNTRFVNKSVAVETITPMQEADGAWRMAGYYIR